MPVWTAVITIRIRRVDTAMMRITRWALLCALCGVCRIGAAQTEAVGDDAPISMEVLRSPSIANMPLRWSVLPQRITNTSDHPYEVSSITTFDDSPGIQFGRRIVVPPRSRLATWQPFLVPDAPPADPYDPQIRELSFRTLLMDARADDDRLIRQEFNSLQRGDTIWLTHPGQVCGLLAPREPQLDVPGGIALYDFVLTGRIQQGIRYNFISLDDGLPPGGAASLEAFDQLVIADDRVLEDLDALTALRRWLYGGGRLWIMLDQVDLSLLDGLLGDEFTGHLVDRVGLTHVHLQADPNGPPNEEKPRTFDRPVEMVRIVADGLDVEFAVDGWPAACWKSCGQGDLLITTLGPDAWVRPRELHDKESQWGPRWETGFIVGPAFDELMSQFFAARPEPLLEPETLETQARDYVGYTVPSRRLVVGMLGGFTLVLIAAGLWLLRTGEGQRLGVIGPAASIVVSLSLMAVARTHRSLPESTALAQWVEPVPGTNDVRMTGAAATFTPDPGDIPFAGRGGRLLPATSGQSGGLRRLVWTGLDHWQWESLPLPQGLHTAMYQSAAVLNSRTSAQATLDAEGVIGRLTLPDGFVGSDAMLVTPSGRMSVELTDGDTFRARASDTLTDGQYIAAGILTDEQSRRGRTLAALLASSHVRFPRQPTLLFWTKPWNLGTSFPGDSANGSALVTLPFSLARPAAGTSICVPSAFITYREAPGPGVDFLTGLYDDRTRTWTERRQPTRAWIRFSLLPGIAPVQPTAARLMIRVSGPMGQLQIAALDDGQTVAVMEWRDPVGTLHLNIDDPRYLQSDRDGGLLLRFEVGDPDQPQPPVSSVTNPTTPFQIESLTLEIDAVVLEAGGAIVSSSNASRP